MSRLCRHISQRISRHSPKISIGVLTLLITIIFTGVSFSIYTIRQIENNVVSPHLAIISTHLGINPKLLKVLVKLQDYELNPNSRNLKKVKMGYRINKASILNDLHSETTVEMHRSFGNQGQLNDIIKRLKKLSDDFDLIVGRPESLKMLRSKLEILYKDWNIYSRKVIQRVEAAQGDARDEWKQQLKLQLYFLLLIAVTSILAISLIYSLYRKQRSTRMMLEQQTLELNDARIVAEQSTAAKSRFLANMSHEIRTPLNGIIGLSRLANERIENPEVRGYLENVVLSGNSLLQIINDILDISKIEANKVELEHVEYSLAELIKTLAATMAFSAKAKAISLRIFTPAKLPEKLMGDPTKLLQILNNLCSNAIKFTEQGGVTVRFDFREKDTKNYLYVAVKDTGIGLSQEQQDVIFTEFVQADDSTTRRFGGTGLGLSIAHSFTKLMSGSIAVHSEQNKGACFELLLPLDETELPKACFTPMEQQGLETIQLKLVSAHQNFLNKKDALPELSPALIPIRDDLVAHGVHVVNQNPSHILYYAEDGQSGLKDDIQALLAQFHKPIVLLASVEQLASLRFDDDHMVSKLMQPYISFRTLNALLGVDSGLKQEGATTGLLLKDTQVLLVEDNKVNQLVAMQALLHFGAEVTIANNGLECLELLKKRQFELILMDIQMPELDGIETTKIITQEVLAPDTPIIALTANVLKEDVDTYLSVGMSAHLSKPFDLTQLYEIASKLLQGKGS